MRRLALTIAVAGLLAPAGAQGATPYLHQAGARLMVTRLAKREVARGLVGSYSVGRCVRATARQIMCHLAEFDDTSLVDPNDTSGFSMTTRWMVSVRRPVHGPAVAWIPGWRI